MNMKNLLAMLFLAAMLFTAAMAETAVEIEATEAPAGAEPTDETVAESADALDALPSPDEVENLAAETPDAEPATVWFEEGFSLTFPAGWVSYPVSDADRARGLRYALGDGADGHFLCIQIKPTALADAKALADAVQAEENLTKTGTLKLNNTDFTCFIDSTNNASCCALIRNGSLVTFAFTPQSDADYMLTATQIMESYGEM